jgi:hypothetical protein
LARTERADLAPTSGRFELVQEAGQGRQVYGVMDKEVVNGHLVLYQ